MSADVCRISTRAIAVKERAAFWQDHICDVFVQLDCSNMADEFYGEIADRSIGDLQLSAVKSAQHQVARTRRQLSRATEDCFLVSLQVKGSGVVEQDGRTALLKPGDLAMYDSTRRYALRFDDDFEELVLKLPRKLVEARLAAPERLTATAIDGACGIGRVAFDFVRSVATQTELLEPSDSTRLSDSVLDIVSMALGSLCDVKTRDVSSCQATQLLRIKTYIRDRLREATLSREEVALANGISIRYLNKLFQADGSTITQYVREARLRHIAQDLVDPRQSGRSISDIAYRWGMSSMPHFSRVFKAHMGVTPKAHREQAQARDCA